MRKGLFSHYCRPSRNKYVIFYFAHWQNKPTFAKLLKQGLEEAIKAYSNEEDVSAFPQETRKQTWIPLAHEH